MKTTKTVSFSAILSALSVLILLIGGMLGTLDLTAAAIASFCVIFAVIEFNYKYAALVYAAASALGFMIVPAKSSVLFFAAFFGFYPIVKSIAERYSKIISYAIKFAVYALSCAAVIFIWLNFFTDGSESILLVTAIIPLAGLIILPIYDFALTQLITFYLRSLRKRIGIDKLLK